MAACGTRLRQILLASVLAPLALWIAGVSLCPTQWLKSRIVVAIQNTARQPVSLSEVRIGWLGDVRLVGLAIGAQPDPWLWVDETELDTRLWAAFGGRLSIGRCTLSGVRLRLHRRADGSLECGDLLGSSLPDAPASSSASIKPDDRERSFEPLKIELRAGELSLIDDPTGTRLVLESVAADAVYEPGRLTVDGLTGMIGGGRLSVAGACENDPPRRAIDAALRLERADFDQGMGALVYLMPLLAGSSEVFEGRIDLELKLHAEGSDLDTLARSLTGSGSIHVADVALARSPLIGELSRVFAFSPEGRVGSMTGSIEIGNSRVTTDDMTIRVGSFPISLQGSTGFDGRLDYTVHSEDLTTHLAGVAHRLPARARELLHGLEQRRALDRLRNLRLTGTIDQVALSIGTLTRGETRHEPAPLRR